MPQITYDTDGTNKWFTKKTEGKCFAPLQKKINSNKNDDSNHLKCYLKTSKRKHKKGGPYLLLSLMWF